MKTLITIALLAVIVSGMCFSQEYEVFSWDETDEFTEVRSQGVGISYFDTTFSTFIVYFRIQDGIFEVLIKMSGDGWVINHLYIKAGETQPVDVYIKGTDIAPDGYRVATIVFGDLTPPGLYLMDEERDPVEYILNAEVVKIRLVYDLRAMPGEDYNCDVVVPAEALTKIKSFDWVEVEK